VVKSASEVAECEITHRPDWFIELEALLLELIEKRNSTLKNYMKHGSTETREILKQARCILKNSMVFKFMEGFQGHHKTLLPKMFRSHREKFA
jgi:hypothetical protein